MDLEFEMASISAACDTPSYFTCSAPSKTASNQLFFYNVVKENVISRSSVLSCIVEAGGGTRLPDAITVASFKKWSAAVEGTKEDVMSRPFSFVCTVLKVPHPYFQGVTRFIHSNKQQR